MDGAEEFDKHKSAFLVRELVVPRAAALHHGWARDGSASGLAMLNHIMGLICPSGRDPVTIQGLQVAHGLVYLVSLILAPVNR